MLAKILLPIQDKLIKMEEYIQKNFEKDHLFIQEVGHYALGSGGKRIRPAIMLLTTLSFGKYNQNIKKFAAVLEYIHTASLMHDDVVDNANYRRNKKTVHSTWNNKTAILVGDYLLAKSFEQLTSIKNFDLIELIVKTVSSLTKGEILQLLHKIDSISEKKYLEIICCKTACFIAAAMQSGGVITGQNKKIQKQLYLCGEYLGMAFQIVDDVLDYRSTKSGKTIGGDFQERKITLPLCKLLEKAEQKEKKKIINFFQKPSSQNINIKEVVLLMEKYEVFDSCLMLAKKYKKQAEKILFALPNNLYQKKLLELADFVVLRQS